MKANHTESAELGDFLGNTAKSVMIGKIIAAPLKYAGDAWTKFSLANPNYYVPSEFDSAVAKLEYLDEIASGQLTTTSSKVAAQTTAAGLRKEIILKSGMDKSEILKFCGDGDDILAIIDEMDNVVGCDDILVLADKFDDGVGGGKTIITPEMESKILEGQRKGNTSGMRGGHSADINNANPKYAVEERFVNYDGTKSVKYITQFEDGNLSKIKTSTLFPDNWSNEKIIDSVNKVGDTPPIGQRISGSTIETLHRGTIDGVEIDVLKVGSEVTAGYPVGKAPTPGFESIY